MNDGIGDVFAIKKLIRCPDCEVEISPDAEACPSCGRINDWVHPTLKRVIEHLDMWDEDVKHKARGHEMHIHSQSHNFWQGLGSLCFAVGVLCLLGSIFFYGLIGFIGLFMIPAVVLFAFVGTETKQHLHIDLRKPDKITGNYDAKFWASVVNIIKG